MKENKIAERELHPMGGAVMLLLLVLGIVLGTITFAVGILPLGYHPVRNAVMMTAGALLGWIVFPIMLGGLKIVKPNEARILLLFGKYHGTIKQSGYYWVNPFCTSFSPAYNAAKAATVSKAKDADAKGQPAVILANAGKGVSMKLQTWNNGRQKVNDVLGNPIIIGAVIIWRVSDPTRAAFAVENYTEYLSIQADSTVRNIARLYPYDTFDVNEDNGEKTLRGSAVEIADSMRDELQKRVADAGLEVEEVRITHLAYAEEIAAAMLQRQQAEAIIAARQKIVDGAVGMVKMAIDKLGDDEIVVLDEERKAAMVSNLLVVLCGNKDAQPVLNSGSIY